MAYATGSATDMGDLLSKLMTFVTTTDGNWTQDQFDDGATVASEGIFAIHHNTITDLYISGKWIANAANNLSLHHALGFVATTTDPGGHTDDSGNGYNAAFGSDAQLEGERCVHDLGDGPFESYHFFSNEEGGGEGTYIHVVVQTTTSEVYRHFGFGQLNKFNDWTGGGYCYGHYHDPSTNSSAVDLATCMLFDGLYSQATTTTARRAATVHAEGLPNQVGVNEKWLSFNPIAVATNSNLNDSAGETKRTMFGGFRSWILSAFADLRADNATGYIPMYPIEIWTADHDDDFVYYLGSVNDIRGVDIFNFSAEQEVTVGSDTWIFFPASRRTEDDVVGRTYYQGVAYKKIT